MFRSLMDRDRNRHDGPIGRIVFLFDVDSAEYIESDDRAPRCCQFARVIWLSWLVGQLLLDQLRIDLCDADDFGLAEYAALSWLDVISDASATRSDVDHGMAL